MSVPKKCNAKDHLFAIRNKGRSSLRRAARADEANPLEMRPGKPRTNRLTFVEDFVLEHSSRGLQFTSIEMGGSL